MHNQLSLSQAESTMTKLLTTQEVADRTTLSEGHLCRLRQTGGGPPFYDLGGESRGAYRYDPQEVDLWLESRKYGNTTEALEDLKARAQKREEARQALLVARG